MISFVGNRYGDQSSKTCTRLLAFYIALVFIEEV